MPRFRAFASPTIAILALVLVSPPAFAQEEDNAATYYNQLQEQLRVLDAQVSDDQWEEYWAFRGNPDATPSAAVRRILDLAAPIMRSAEKAVAQDYVDFHIAYEDGPGALLPHLSVMRQAYRLLSTDARVRMHDGDMTGATRRMTQALGMTGDLSHDRVLISSLVSAAIFTGAGTDDIRFAMDRGLLSQAEAKSLLGSVRDLMTSDPFGFSSAFEGERDFMAGYMKEHFLGEGGKDRMLDEFEGWWFGDNSEFFLAEMEGMDQGQIDAAVHGYDLAMERVVEASRLDDLGLARQEVQRILGEVESGIYGPFTPFMIAAFDHVFATMGRLYDELVALEGDLENAANDPEGTKALLNAAVFYQRAMAQLTEAPPEWRTLDLTKTDAWDSALAEALQSTLEGSKIKRCDFALLETRRPNPGVGNLASLAELVGLLNDDARRLVVVGDLDEAIDRLGASYAVANHLARDEAILSAVVAHHLFDDTTAQGREMLADSELTPEQGEALAAAIKVHAGNRFGYPRSILRERNDLAAWLRRRAPHDWKMTAEAMPRSWSASRLLSGRALADADGRNRYWTIDANSDSLRALAGVVDLRAIEALQSLSADFGEGVRAGEVQMLPPQPWPLIVNVEDRMEQATMSVRVATEWVNSLTVTEAR